METMVFSRAEIAERLSMADCIVAVENAFGLLGRGDVAVPATLSVHVPAGAFHIKAGVLPHHGRRYFVAKTNGNFPANPESGLPTIQGVVLLCDADDGRILALLDSGELTALRTAAATAVAAGRLARANASTAAIIGCGLQARAQLRGLCAVLPIREVFAYDVNAPAAAAFALEMSALLGIRVRAGSTIAGALKDADACVTCTTSREFLVFDGMVKPGAFVAGVGVDNENKRELAPQLLGRSKVVTDLRDQCARMGDLQHAISAGVMRSSAVHADLAEIVAGTKAGREDDHDIIVFDSTGLALQDVAAAVAIYESAEGKVGGGVPTIDLAR